MLVATLLQTTVRDLEKSGLRQLGFVSLTAYADPNKGLLAVEFVPESISEEKIVSPAAGLGPSPPKRGDEGLQELPLQMPPEPCTEASLASLAPRYVALEKPHLLDGIMPTALQVVCGAGFSPSRGNEINSDRAVCDNGKWIFEAGLDCRRTCTTPVQTSLQPQGAYNFSAPDPYPQYRALAAAASSLKDADFRHTAAPQGTNGVDSGQKGARHGSSVFVSCADGYAAGRGREGAWIKCVDGIWTLERPSFSCHRVCPSFPHLGNAYAVTGEGNHQGDERHVSCNRGFYPQRRTHRLVCSEGSWPTLPFSCSRAVTPDLREGVAGFQKILQQMFSREGVMGFIVFSILVLAAALVVILCWLFRCRGRAHRQQRERAEAIQALKLAGVPMTQLAAVARARLGLSTGSSFAASGDESRPFSPPTSRRKAKRGKVRVSACDDSSSTQGQEMVDLSGRIPARPPGDAVPPPSEGGPTGRSSHREDHDESTPVPEWLASERILPAQAFRRSPDPRCYSAAPALSNSFGSTPGFSLPPPSISSSSAGGQGLPIVPRLHQTSSQDNDTEVELMHSRDEEEAVTSLETATEKEDHQQRNPL